MRKLFVVLMIFGCSLAKSNSCERSKVGEYHEEQQLLIQVLEDAIKNGPSKSKFIDLVESIDRKYQKHYVIKAYEPTKEDCIFWYGYHQLVNYIEDNGTHEKWTFVLSVVRGDSDITIGSYCSPPLIELEAEPKKWAPTQKQATHFLRRP